jgi:hypothetical protein
MMDLPMAAALVRALRGPSCRMAIEAAMVHATLCRTFVVATMAALSQIVDVTGRFQ